MQYLPKCRTRGGATWRLTAMRRLVLVLASICLALPCYAQQSNDLREFRIGESVQELPARGYVHLQCDDAPGMPLGSWLDYARCPSDARGLRAVAFEYDASDLTRALTNDSYEGTRVAGQPVLPALLITDDGHIGGIRVRTDPRTRLYLRKKAFLFGLQARARYGADGWNCIEAKPSPNEEPVGGVFIKEHCEKTTATRHLIVDRQLYRPAGKPLQDFVGASTLLIFAPK
jgi:hypothetical protein